MIGKLGNLSLFRIEEEEGDEKINLLRPIYEWNVHLAASGGSSGLTIW